VKTCEKGICSLTWEHYQEAVGLRKSHLDLIHRSPAHLQQELLEPTPATDAMKWGSLFHMFILEPDLFDASYAVLPEKLDMRTNAGKAAWQEWQDANPGRIAVDRPSLDVLEAMRDSIYSNPFAKNALTGGKAEQSLFWRHVVGVDEPVLCKGRLDYISPQGFLADVKTTKDARPDEFSRSCWSFRYHVQAAFYSDGYEAITKAKPEGFLIVAIEKEKPYAVATYLVNEDMTDQGRREYLADVQRYAECVKSGVWPAYAEEVQSLMLPVWAQDRREG